MNIDKDKIAQEFGFTRSDIDTLIDLFYKSAITTLEQMRVMIEKKDMQGIINAAHTIQGSAGTLKLNEIAQLAMSIEIDAKNSEDVDYMLYHQQLVDLLDLCKFH